jgi:hypothetical protein
MPFAFQAVKLSFSDGVYRTLKVDRSGYQMMSEDNLRTQNAAAETGWLCDEIGSTFPRFMGRPDVQGASSSAA